MKSFNTGKMSQITAENDDLQASEDEEVRDTVNMLQSNSGAVKCRYIGVGTDGKLKCKWLAGPESCCQFNQLESD